LLTEIIKEQDRVTSFANLVKPALSGLSDTGSFTEAQLKCVAQYEEQWKKKKKETDNDDRDRGAEKQKLIRDQMKQIGQNSQGFSLKSYRRSKKDKHEPEPEPDFENSTSNTDDPSTNETMNTISAEERRQSPLLSGVAKVIEKQKKEEKKKER